MVLRATRDDIAIRESVQARQSLAMVKVSVFEKQLQK